MYTYFCCVDVIILPKSRHTSTKKVVESPSAPASPFTSLSNKHTIYLYKDIHDLNNVQQKSLLRFARSIFSTNAHNGRPFVGVFRNVHPGAPSCSFLFSLRKESTW